MSESDMSPCESVSSDTDMIVIKLKSLLNYPTRTELAVQGSFPIQTTP